MRGGELWRGEPVIKVS